jgi:hypothetical protein
MVAASTARRRAAESDAWLAINVAEMLAIRLFLPLHQNCDLAGSSPSKTRPATS